MQHESELRHSWWTRLLIMRAPVERLRPSAAPRLYGANCHSLTIRNPPGNKSMLLLTYGRRKAKLLENTDATPESSFCDLLEAQERVPVAIFSLSGSLTYSSEDYFLLCFGWRKSWSVVGHDYRTTTWRQFR